jgi:hypothetical protein
MTDNKMFQLHPARHQETGKGWQVTGKVRLWQERNGAKKGELEHIYIYIYIQGVSGGMCETSGECSLGQTIPI